jgi:hypothetical protein
MSTRGAEITIDTTTSFGMTDRLLMVDSAIEGPLSATLLHDQLCELSRNTEQV